MVERKTRSVGRPRALTEVQHLVCIEAYTTKAASCRELAWVYGVSCTAMQGYLRGFFRSRRTRDDEKILKAREAGGTVRGIALELGISPNTVWTTIRDNK